MEEIPYLTVIEAPWGYGQKSIIDYLSKAYKEKKIIRVNFLKTKSFYELLSKACLLSNLQIPQNDTPEEFIKLVRESKLDIIFIADDFHNNTDTRADDFIEFFLTNKLDNMSFVISSENKSSFPIHKYTSSFTFSYLTKEDLIITPEKASVIWSNENLDFTDEDKKFIDNFKGWGQAFYLYLGYRKKHLTSDKFKELLQKSIIDYFNSQKNFDIIKNNVEEIIPTELKRNAEYWIYVASKENLDPEQTQVFLQRALTISESYKNDVLTLQILTKLAHSYSLSGSFYKFDTTLEKAEKFFDKGDNTDKIAFLYLKANRLRQLCKHEEALSLINQVIEIPCNERQGLSLKTRSGIISGLTYYQMGQYEETRKEYNKVSLIANAENNKSLSLELKIMLTFLEALEGKQINKEEDYFKEEIELQPLKSQPLMILNLIFLKLLGENFDLNESKLMLKRIKEVNYHLNLEYLKPLISDIEARIYRFTKEYEKALEFHEKALAYFSEDSFEFLQASLNKALTLIRKGEKEKAKNILLKILHRAEEVKASGIVREIKVLLNEIDPQNKSENIFISGENIYEDKFLGISLFGGFKVKSGTKFIDKWPRKKSKHILISLILNPNGIHRETLADNMFFSDGVENPLKNLDVTIHSLRKILEPDRKTKESSFILFKDACYLFNRSNPHSIDLDEFEKTYKELKSLAKDSDCYLQKAVRLIDIYKNGFLPEIDFADEWIAEREDFRVKTVNTCTQIVKTAFESNNLDYAELFAEKLLKIDNLDEYAYQSIMNIASKKKDKKKLKNTYDRMASAFRQEIDDTPSDELISAYKNFLQNM